MISEPRFWWFLVLVLVVWLPQVWCKEAEEIVDNLKKNMEKQQELEEMCQQLNLVLVEILKSNKLNLEKVFIGMRRDPHDLGKGEDDLGNGQIANGESMGWWHAVWGLGRGFGACLVTVLMLLCGWKCMGIYMKEISRMQAYGSGSRGEVRSMLKHLCAEC